MLCRSINNGRNRYMIRIDSIALKGSQLIFNEGSSNSNVLKRTEVGMRTKEFNDLFDTLSEWMISNESKVFSTETLKDIIDKESIKQEFG